MRGVYRANIKISALAAAKTLIYLTAAAGKVVEILSVFVTNSSNATNQQLEAQFAKITALGTPTATAITPTPTEQGDQAATTVVKGNVTASEPTYSSTVTFGYQGFATVGGYQYAPVPEERNYITNGDSWGLRMLSTPAAFDCEIEVSFREIG